MPDPDRFLTVEEVVDLLRTTPSALYTLRHRGVPPGSLAVKVGRRLLWRRSDLDTWFDSKKLSALS